ncbi:MAG TPA: SpoIID/LytB domain-containing protein [Thermoanaerobaculaceae bacterium]|nr:SpoIID/LytB domain-containing protein [Thermoanaerobaculaceae bacterium]
MLVPLAWWVVACRSVPPRPVSPTPRPASVRVATPVPAVTPASIPTPTPTPQPTPELPPLRPGADRETPLVRVLLQSVAWPLSLGDPGQSLVVDTPSGRAELRGGLVATSRGATLECQVGAYGEASNAEATVARLHRAGLGARVESGSGLRRVIAFGQPGMTPEDLLAGLVKAGIAEPGRLVERGSPELCVQGEADRKVCGLWLRITAGEDRPIRAGLRVYRGSVEIRRVNGDLVVVNAVNLEAYLRGVVPAELGPKTFPAVEALKAQAVAARTYAVAHLGDHAADGWDLCDTMSCQVYEGTGVEHPLSDRAVAETAGQILTFGGKPVQAFYHSTCGGHTEDAVWQFPQADAPYLKGVPCRGDGERRLGAEESPGPWLDSEGRLALVAEELARTLGLPPSAQALATRLGGNPAGPEVGGMVAAFGLEETSVLVAQPGHELGDAGVQELLRVFRLPLAPPPAEGRERWELAVVVRLAQLVGSLRQVVGRLGPGDTGLAVLREDGQAAMALPDVPAVIERRGEQWRRSALVAQVGSPVAVWCAGEVCPLIEVEPRATADEGSSWSWWRRELSFEDVGQRLQMAGVRGVRVVQRGVSGRAVRVTVRHAGGETTMAGLAFRYALELPDSLFVVQPALADGKPGLRFLGRGWGHGVGMCQNGAFGLAVGGASYREILAHYYPGTSLGSLPPAR